MKAKLQEAATAFAAARNAGWITQAEPAVKPRRTVKVDRPRTGRSLKLTATRDCVMLAWRQERNATVREAAKAHGVAVGTWAKCELGQRKRAFPLLP
jgi:hypothetical protein